VVASSDCTRTVRRVEVAPGQPAALAELWQDPTDIGQRDLFHGPGGSELVPRDPSYTFVARDTTGRSPGFDVRDQRGLLWSVKFGSEAQTEVVTSRILWAIGFHQPPTYYVDGWTLAGEVSGPQPAGRFRPERTGYRVAGEWSWYENPFVGSQPYQGLIVANLILNNWDWKTSNNKIYELPEREGGVARWFVVRDLGASLGKTSYPRLLTWFRLRGFGQGSRNDLADFEEQGFIREVRDDSTIEFDYRGIYRDLVATVTPTDVRWTCALLSRLSDQQWNDAFRSASYSPEHAARFVAKLKEKIAQGLELADR
jgi:hypothetical protein